MLSISKGPIARAQKVVIYGPEGVGKSTLASCFPSPLFIDVEGGTAHLDVCRVEPPRSWASLLALIDKVIEHERKAQTRGASEYSTLVLDTADWAEKLAMQALCDKYKWSSIESANYGKGYVYLAEEFTSLLAVLDRCLAVGMNVVVAAHAKMRKFEQPDEMGAYDRWELKLTKNCAPLLKEWADMVLFCNYQTYVINTENNTKKAQGGKRVMYTSHHPCWDAKNRVGLPDVLDLNWKSIAHVFERKVESAATVENSERDEQLEQLKILMELDGITEDALIQCITEVCKAANRPFDRKSIKELSTTQIKWAMDQWKNLIKGIKNTKGE